MCFISPVPYINPFIESKTIELLYHDIRDVDEFKPLVDHFMKSKYNDELKIYCEKANKIYEEYLKKLFTIWSIEIGFTTVVVPIFIKKLDVIDQSEEYKLWIECYNKYMNNQLSIFAINT
jgi:hypothetical protein